uniref:non-specific serine/threonine protein kinase n=1 Tax=Myripristis murdjan TaxID=586833 RepID=A0A667XFU7_9TELE
MCKDEKIIKELIIGRRVGFYKVRGEIGYGTFSRVKLAFHALTKDKVALKVLDKTRLDVEAHRLLSREISNMEVLHHTNVVRLYEVVETPSRVYLVLEYAGGGDLHTRICDEGKLSDKNSKITFAQILSAIKYLHNNNIIHRDLKAENVLFTSSACVKVADFGFSTHVSNRNNALDTFCGSPPYAAPELFRDECYVGPPVDVWAMGVLLFFMVTGTMPFRAETMGKLRRCILDGTYTIPPWVPGPCQRLIKGILKPVPTDRYAVDQMLEGGPPSLQGPQAHLQVLCAFIINKDIQHHSFSYRPILCHYCITVCSTSVILSSFFFFLFSFFFFTVVLENNKT